MSDATIRLQAAAELELRRRLEKRKFASRYDWFGDECECGKALGECRDHPRARPSQRPPGSHRSSESRDDWRIWTLMAGRGAGKTRTAAEFVTKEVESGRLKWVALINETVKEVRDVQIEHPKSGLIAVAPPWFKPIYEPSKSRVTWPNGAFATIYTAETPDALRGPEFGLAWLDEMAKWRFGQQEVWDNLQMCLRALVEPRPRVVVTTTPRSSPTFKAVLKDSRTVVTRGTTLDNTANLDPDFITYIQNKYGGTRLGRQELEAILLEDNVGALWTTAMLDDNRLAEVPKKVDLVRVAVGVDPQAGAMDPESGAYTGIVVAARGSDGHGYVLEDPSVKGSPEIWAKAAVDAYERHKADVLAAEVNNGGDMVIVTINIVDPNIPVKKLWASRGKAIRAEPISRLYEQGKIHHIGSFPALEEQLTTWVPDSGQKSPDRLDALVWALTEVMLGGGGEPGTVAIGGSRAAYGPVFGPR